MPPWQLCDNCNGRGYTGWWLTGTTPCSHCNGTGYLPGGNGWLAFVRNQQYSTVRVYKQRTDPHPITHLRNDTQIWVEKYHADGQWCAVLLDEYTTTCDMKAEKNDSPLSAGTYFIGVQHVVWAVSRHYEAPKKEYGVRVYATSGDATWRHEIPLKALATPILSNCYSQPVTVSQDTHSPEAGHVNIKIYWWDQQADKRKEGWCNKENIKACAGGQIHPSARFPQFCPETPGFRRPNDTPGSWQTGSGRGRGRGDGSGASGPIYLAASGVPTRFGSDAVGSHTHTDPAHFDASGVMAGSRRHGTPAAAPDQHTEDGFDGRWIFPNLPEFTISGNHVTRNGETFPGHVSRSGGIMKLTDGELESVITMHNGELHITIQGQVRVGRRAAEYRLTEGDKVKLTKEGKTTGQSSRHGESGCLSGDDTGVIITDVGNVIPTKVYLVKADKDGKEHWYGSMHVETAAKDTKQLFEWRRERAEEVHGLTGDGDLPDLEGVKFYTGEEGNTNVFTAEQLIVRDPKKFTPEHIRKLQRQEEKPEF